MENTKVAMKGTLLLELRDENGVLKETRRKDNIIVSGGFDFICQQCGGSVTTVMNAIALGTGSTTPVNTQTALVTEVCRAAATYSHTVGTQVWQLQATFNPGTGTAALQEAGCFNSTTASSGVMLDRVTFSVINKGANDTLTATFQFTLS
jgi:hypothetical protein